MCVRSFIERFSQYAREISLILLRKDRSDRVTRHLVKGSSGSFGLNVVSYFLLFLTSIVLTRILGASEYGVYIYAISWLNVLTMPAGMGLNRTIIRDISAYLSNSAWGYLAGQIKWANRIVLSASVATTSCAIVVIGYYGSWQELGQSRVMLLAIISLPLVTLTRLQQSVLQGLGRVVIGQLPELIIQPSAFLVLIGMVFFVFEKQMDSLWTIGGYVIAMGLALCISVYMLIKSIPDAAFHSQRQYDSRIWFRSGLSMMLLGLLSVLNSRADILMLGALSGSDDVGVYNIVFRGGELVVFIMATVHAALGPTISQLHSQKDSYRLQQVITKSNHIIFALTVPVALVLIGLSYWYLLIFGDQFVRGQLALTIICFSKLFNVAMGPVALLLIMTKNERLAVMSLGVSALLNVILNAILIPRWGLEGAATATAVSAVVWSIVTSVLVYKRLGIYSPAVRVGKRRLPVT